MSRYTREIHTQQLARAVRHARLWRSIFEWVDKRSRAADDAVRAAAMERLGTNPRYSCGCGDCWRAFADELINGKVPR